MKFITLSILFVFCAICSCNDVDVILPDEENSTVIIDGGSVDIETDNGEIGVLLDARSIHLKGYNPVTAEISFPEHSKFNSVIEIDQDLDIAVLKVLNDSLTEEEKIDFAKGVMAVIKISSHDEILAIYEDNIVLDDSNSPVPIKTDLEFIPSPINLNKDIRQLMIFKNIWASQDLPSTGTNTLVSSWEEGGFHFSIEPYNLKDYGPYQFFYFYHIEGNKYKIRVPSICRDLDGNVIECPEINYYGYEVLSEGAWFYMEKNIGSPSVWAASPTEDESFASIFELVLKEDGWMEMFFVDDDLNLQPWRDWVLGNFYFGTGLTGIKNAEIRLVSDNIDYQVEDIGITYFQPIVPPIQLDFAYHSTINNCSVTTLVEEVGRVETKSRETSINTSESFQLLTQDEAGVSIKVGYELEAKVGGGEATGGSSVTNTGSLEVEGTYQYTTSQTTTRAKTYQETYKEEYEVSRKRTVTVPPYKGVEIFDFIKSVDNVRIPFVKKLKISGFNKFDGSKVSGLELKSAAIGNLFGGIITKIEDEHVEVSIRGSSYVNSYFEASSAANDILEPCN